ncbi:MAG: sugar transferase [bacterium]
MYRQKQLFLLVGDILLVMFATWMAFFIRFGYFFPPSRDLAQVSILTVGIYLTFLYIFDLYGFHLHKSWEDNVLRHLMVALLAAGPTVFCSWYLPLWSYRRDLWFIQTILIFTLTFLWRSFYLPYVFRPTGPKKEKVLILGSEKAGHLLYEWVQRANMPFQIMGFLDDDPILMGRSMNGAAVLGTTSQMFEIGQRIGVKTAIIGITREKRPELIHKVLEAKLKGWNIRDIIKDYERSTGRVPVEYIHDEWFLLAEGFYLLKTSMLQKLKRLTDITFAAFLLIVSSPILLITALAIHLDSAGPVIFRQVRVGKDGKTFELLKLRSMHLNAEENGVAWAQKNDARITRVGRLIRYLRIDEIPQMVNVLRGEMSLIGPRPERPEFVSQLESKIPYYSVRHCIKPGITGWAQIKYPYGSSVSDALHKLEYDLYYVKNMTPLLDFEICLKTIGVMLFGQGAR